MWVEKWLFWRQEGGQDVTLVKREGASVCVAVQGEAVQGIAFPILGAAVAQPYPRGVNLRVLWCFVLWGFVSVVVGFVCWRVFCLVFVLQICAALASAPPPLNSAFHPAAFLVFK